MFNLEKREVLRVSLSLLIALDTGVLIFVALLLLSPLLLSILPPSQPSSEASGITSPVGFVQALQGLYLIFVCWLLFCIAFASACSVVVFFIVEFVLGRELPKSSIPGR